MIVSPFRVVLDANILFQAAVRDTLLRAASESLFQLYWSQHILDELERNLIAGKRVPETKARRLRGRMEEIFPEAMVSGYDALIPAMPNKKEDRHVAAAAVKAGAQVIVTNNLKDFKRLPDGIEAQSADEFLGNLLELDEALMLELLQQQANALKHPSLSLDQLLDQMAKLVPAFTQQVRSVRELSRRDETLRRTP